MRRALILRLLLCANLAILPMADAFAARAVGIDVSHYQGDITQSEWNSVFSSGRTFGWTKATEGSGSGLNDATFVNNMTRARAAGLYLGAYHFGRPENDSVA